MISDRHIATLWAMSLYKITVAWYQVLWTAVPVTDGAQSPWSSIGLSPDLTTQEALPQHGLNSD